MSERPPDEERLSGTLFSSLQNLANDLGWLSGVFVLVGIASLVLGIILLIFISDLRLYSYIIMGAGAGLLLISLTISFQTVSRVVTGRRGRYSTNTIIMIIAFIGIAAVVNFLAFENSARMDVTALKQFSLAPRTVDLLKNLNEPVEAKAFFGPAGSPQEEAFQNQIENLLHEFKIRSNKFSYEFVDPDANPLIAREYEITRDRYGTVAFESMESKKRHHVFPSFALEQGFVTGLLIITGQEQKHVYFLTGHGERDIQNLEPDTEGFGLGHNGIVNENYSVSPLNLLIKCNPRDPQCDEPQTGQDRLLNDRCEKRQTGEEGPEDSQGQENPEDAERRCEKKVNMILVAGPSKDLLEGEAEILDSYLKSGGKMLFLLEPGTHQGFRDFLARWGIVVGDGHIVDTQRSLGDDNEVTVIARDQYIDVIPEPLNSILGISRLTGRLDTTYFPGLTPLKPAEEGVVFFPAEPAEEGEEEELATVFGTALAVTSTESWLIKDTTRNKPQPGDLKGFFFPAVAVKAIAPLDGEPPSSLADVKTASIIVFGDSDFATNRYFYTSSNSDFFLNSINWLVGDVALADIRPKPIAFRELVVTRNEFDFMRYSGWLLLPALMILLGGVAWWRRR